MANANKIKGDRAERALLAHLNTQWPHLMRPDAARMLGAGRRDDTGDLIALPGVTIQVKHWNNLPQALASAASGAAAQRRTAAVPFGVGVCKVPGARAPKPIWLAAVLADEWPGPAPEDPPCFRQSGRMLTWLTQADETPAQARARAQARTARQRATLAPAPVDDVRYRIACWDARGTTYLVSPLEAWVAAWQQTAPQHGPLTSWMTAR